jgi:uncharacterized protein
MTIATIALSILAVLAALIVLLWWRQERIVFQPPAPPWPDAGTARRIDYRTADGEQLFGYVVGDPPRSPGMLLVFHGNADLAAWQIPWATELANRTGWSVFLAEYRGYAGASGTPSYEGSAHDARAAYAVVRDSLGVAPDRIAFFGHSLGTAIASELASEARPAALVLQSPFTSARDMARIIIARPLHALWEVIARVHFDTRERVRSIDAPVWVAHGTNDFIIPARMGRAVHEAARVKGELLIVPTAGHNDVATVGGDAYWDWLARALAAVAQR